MRKPRPQDFDPDYKVSSSVQPDEINIQDSIPIKPHSTRKKELEPDRTEKRTEIRSDNRSEVRSEIRSDNRSEIRTEINLTEFPLKRRTKRYSFEFYDDQIRELRKIKIQMEMKGESIVMSDIVRLALDQYLKNR